jgi:hypothetical protein
VSISGVTVSISGVTVVLQCVPNSITYTTSS